MVAAQQRRLTRVDDVPVWSLSCFYIRKGYRRKGVTSILIAAAIDAAKRAGAPALEACPLDAIRMDVQDFNLAGYSRDIIYTKEFLMGNEKKRPWEEMVLQEAEPKKELMDVA